ncbi:MAG: DNA helicase-2/ATP-dependent DNA helicase PcrA [Polaribacter sp.]|jgi:DNA helicase-2/ATP-dependent DNA helicase PcrA
MQEATNPKRRKEYNALFTEELSRLNPGQKAAVESIEGPVMVIAGPGTGKTHILTARIGRILMETDAQAGNILCLTFTDAGVLAMRERLLSFIGPEAHRVHIYTFHSFCNNVIKDNLELFGRHDLEPISDLERIEIIRDLLDSIPEDHALKPKAGDPYFYEKNLQDLFQRMKAENWSVDLIHNSIKTYLADLPNREDYIYKQTRREFKKGDIKQWKFDEQVEKMALLSTAVNLFPTYTQMMQEARRYDFEDMIQWVLKGFENHDGLLRSYQERYQYFLVDEYQDTNGSQNQILQKLIDYWESPNIFIVGDDDQSIYEFQGARLKNLVDFHNDYASELNLILLKDNYRSSQHILDTSKSVIENNKRRIVTSLPGIEKILTARNMLFARSTVQPFIREYPNRLHEETGIAEQLLEIQAKGISLSEVAVIYAKHRQAENLIALLEKKSIPYNTKREVNILDLPLIRNLRTLIHYLYLEYVRPGSGEHLLYRILHFNFWGIDQADLHSISLFLAKHQQKSSDSWRIALGNRENMEKLSLKTGVQVQEAIDLLEELIGDYVNMSLPIFIEKLINRSGWLGHIMLQDDKIWQIQIMNTFMSFVKKEAHRNPRLSLKKLLETLSSMDANRLAIRLQRNIQLDDGVNLITAHSCKGLEFQYVFILDAVKDQWEPGRSYGGRRFTFPDTLTQSGEEDAMEARRRLFYVAITRAKEYLYISYAKENEKGKAMARTVYIDEILAATQIEVEKKSLPTDLILDAQFLLLREQEVPNIPKLEKALADTLLENFVLSISSLNSYLRCPLSFYYEKVLRLPSVQSEAASYGTAIHFALRRQFEKMKLDTDKSFPPVDFFVGFFEEEMRRYRAYFRPKEYDRRMSIGKRILQKYYQQYIDNWPKQVLIEHDVRNVEMEGIPLTGAVDRIDVFEQGRVHIVDYKTGSLDKNKVRQPTKAKPLGGNYWRQLYFYKILFETAQPEKVAQSAAISYMEPDSKGEFKEFELTYSGEYVEVVKDMIRDSWKKIQNHEFYEGCNEQYCVWCNFVKGQRKVDSLADKEIEELDD